MHKTEQQTAQKTSLKQRKVERGWGGGGGGWGGGEGARPIFPQGSTNSASLKKDSQIKNKNQEHAIKATSKQH